MAAAPTPPVNSDSQAQLDALGRRLADQGYHHRAGSYFSDNGIVVFTAAQAGVIEASVFLYERNGSWVARVTSQGGSHWIRAARTCAELEGPALEALRSTERPPARGWLLD
jgi:hypothetical protein